MFKSLLSGFTGDSFYELQLAPSSEPICATESRFCLDHPVTLTLREKLFSFSGDDFKISCLATGIAYFQCQGRTFSLRDKKILRDTYGTAVANFKEQLFSFTDAFHIYAGDNSEKKLCKCRASFNFLKAKLTTNFTDVVTTKNRQVVLKGDWRDKRCVIYLGEPKQGGIPLAKIYRPFNLRSHFLDADSYHLEIVAGVDIALMVILCIALDEHARD